VVLGCLSVGRPYVRKWPFMVRRYGRCWIYGPNYVKLSRFYAVQLFSMCIGHYAALPPVRSDPHWPHSYAITASIRLALTQALQHPLLATQTSAVATTTCLDYLCSHTRAMRPSTASPIYLYAYSQRILGVAPSPLASRPHTATTTCLDYLRSHIPERCAHPRPHRYTSTPALSGYWVRHHRPSLPDHTLQHPLLATRKLASSNHDKSRLSTPAYINDAPIHDLADIRLAYCQRILGAAPPPLALAETLQHPLLATRTSAVATTTCPDYLHPHT
jgi:hypothetical protein